VTAIPVLHIRQVVTLPNGKHRPHCTCGWKGRASRSGDQANGQFSGHIARATDLALPIATFCKYCGGNDETPPDHCMDCTRPGAKENTC
jgi:hypothetical protein